jgi:beta-xylosidase
MKKDSRLWFALGALCALACLSLSALLAGDPDNRISLAGEWRFLMTGPQPGATQQELPALEFHDTIQLPGTTETNRKGPENPDRWAGGLTRLYRFNGPAWYERDVAIPETWRGRRVVLRLERTKYTQVWVDGHPRGEKPILCTPQEYVLGGLAPGSHRLTIMVDNTRRPVPGEMHQMSDNTQGNWNGIIGCLELRASEQVWIDDAQVYPDVAGKSARVKIKLGNATGQSGQGVLTLSLAGEGARPSPITVPATWKATGGEAEARINLGDSARLWDEFHPALYELNVKLDSEGARDERSLPFGLREFKARAGQFTINGRVTFLRGKHDGCVFPLTGHPPMDVEGWLEYLRRCREYGINHLRFHSWTPPDAAFAAADQLGMYLQPELPFWGEYTEAERRALMPEAERILRVYGNHPSFVMFALGNECRGSRQVMASMVGDLRSMDDRRLYAQGSNNFLWDPNLAEGDDYWTTVRVRNRPGAPVHNVRGSFATVDGANGQVQIGPPDTLKDYSEAIAGIPVPVIGHEAGQYTVYPNFEEIGEYTGVFRARNLEHFRDKLAAAGMIDQAGDFFRASGKLSALCYREEIELALRTPGFGGFQLLDLQDFPGQGTALVGVLNALMESKDAITPEEWRQFCAPVVLLARFQKYTWTSPETFTAHVDVAHYGEADLPTSVLVWTIENQAGKAINSGRTPVAAIRQGGVRPIAELSIPLANVQAPAHLTLKLSLEGTGVATSYPLWVYPANAVTQLPTSVMVARSFDRMTRQALAEGGRVLLIPDSAQPLASTVGGGFTTDFWCWPMFHNTPGTMGLLIDAAHPALRLFPTDSHSDWQWFDLARRSQPLILDSLPADCRPFVQVIDNLDRVHRLGLMFEAKVDTGRLLVCASDLLALTEKPEARQLLASLLDYAGSDRFDPRVSLTLGALVPVLQTADAVAEGAAAASAEPLEFPVTIRVNAAARDDALRPIWRFFGADEPNYAYMKDGETLLSQLGALAPQSVYFRTHNLLNSGDGTPALKWGSTGIYSEDAGGKPVYDWTIVDRIFDTYLERGVKPYVQLGFMPQALSTKPTPYEHDWKPNDKYATIFTGWAYPPKDYKKWAELAYQWTRHCVQKYGRQEVESWYWEVWNEPDIPYWQGTPEEYHKLYDFAVDGVRRALPTARVGGPESTSPGNEKAAQFLRDFLEHCLRGTNYATGGTGSPLDFISFHAKGRPAFVDGHVQMGISYQLQDIDRGFEIVAGYPELRDKPIVIGECDPDGCAACAATFHPQNAYRNTTLFASYTAASFARIYDLAEKRGVNLAGALTWSFEFEGQPLFAGFRALATGGLELPVLNVFRMFSKMGGQRVAVTSSSAASVDDIRQSGVRGSPDVSALASLQGRTVSVLVWHYHDVDVSGPDAAVRLELRGLPQLEGQARVLHYRIDHDHSNSYEAWKKMGSPAQPTPEQYAELQKAARLAELDAPQTATIAGGRLDLSFRLPRQAVSLVVVELAE